MKRFLSLALVLFLCGCGPASPADTPFALENPNGDRLALGMSQTELDALLTPEEGVSSQSQGPVTLIDYGGGADGPVSIAYRSDKAVSLNLGFYPNGEAAAPEDVSWSIQGITLGSREEDVRAAFQEPTRKYDQDLPSITCFPTLDKILTYDYLSDGTLLLADTGDNAFSLVFFVADGKVVGLSLFLAEQGHIFLPSTQMTKGGP